MYIKDATPNHPAVSNFWIAVRTLDTTQRQKVLFSTINGGKVPYLKPPATLKDANPPFKVSVPRSLHVPFKFEPISSAAVVNPKASAQEIIDELKKELG